MTFYALMREAAMDGGLTPRRLYIRHAPLFPLKCDFILRNRN